MNATEYTQLMNHNILPVALFLVALVIIIILNRNWIKSSWQDFKTRYCLNRLGYKQVSNFQWPDGLDHYFVIDKLILRHNGITLLVYKNYPGKIFCAENIDDWTQMVGRKSYKFRNPFYELDNQLKTISSYIPDVPVNAYLFFDRQAVFPKGHPDRIITPGNIPAELKADKKLKVKKSVMSAWQKLVSMA